MRPWHFLSRYVAANALPSSLVAEFPVVLTPVDLKFQLSRETQLRTRRIEHIAWPIPSSIKKIWCVTIKNICECFLAYRCWFYCNRVIIGSSRFLILGYRRIKRENMSVLLFNGNDGTKKLFHQSDWKWLKVRERSH